jgi:hypothetical protein
MSYIQRNKGFITSSKLKSYLDCHEKYRLQYIEEIEQETSPSMDTGIAAHLLIQE